MGQLRIIAGQWRRTPIPVLERPGLRPTPDRVRETVFNWLNTRLTVEWPRVRALDLFAGSGALGLEAASRGAASVTWVEQDRTALAGLQALLTRLQPAPGQQLRALAAEACGWMSQAPAAAMDLIFLDPPYGTGLLEKALPLAARLLAPGGLIYLEREGVIDAHWLAQNGLTLPLVAEGKAGKVCHALVQAPDPSPW